VISFKSQGLEKMGFIFTGFLFAGFVVLLRNSFTTLKQFLKAKLQRQNRVLSAWSHI
jgi:hypothetical protein